MQQQERFMVRTVKCVDDRYIYENTVANGRTEAIRQAERIGSVDKDDHMTVRAFLEGHLPDESKSIDFFATVKGVASSYAAIYKIDG